MKKIISMILATVLLCLTTVSTVFAAGLAGDANGDDKLTAADARMVLRIALGIETAEDKTLLDVNGDGFVTATDARYILRASLGLEGETDLNTPEKQYNYFIKAFKGVKERAQAATIVKTNVYNYDNHLSGDDALTSIFNALLNDLMGETEINETYTGQDITKNFPPAGTVCRLKMDDIVNIDCKEDGDYYIISMVVNGEKEPTHGTGVGAVASVMTKEDLEQELGDLDIGIPITVDCDYQDARVEAKIEKATGKMVAYHVDSPMILKMGASNISFEIGFGLEEWWTIAY